MAFDFLPFSPPKISDEGIKRVVEVLQSGWIGTGPLTKEFEEKFCNYLDASFGVAVSSCTSGIFLSLKALGVGPGDEVITTAMTFCSTVNAIIHCGATPVLVDVDSEYGNMNTSLLSGLVTSRTKAIIPVHYTGMPCNMDDVMAVARSNGLYVVEDCAHSIEAKYKDQATGTFGDVGVFSFYATKNIAVGEGGMVVARSQELAHRISTISLHGLSRGAWQRFSQLGKRTYDIVEVGYKANFTDLQAAIALSQLEEIDQNYKRRTEIWDFYDGELAGLGVTLPRKPSEFGVRHALHLYVCRLPEEINRDAFVEEVSITHSLALGIHYKAIPQFELYSRQLGLDETDFPVAQSWGRSCVSLSLSPGTSDAHLERTVAALKGALS